MKRFSVDLVRVSNQDEPRLAVSLGLHSLSASIKRRFGSMAKVTSFDMYGESGLTLDRVINFIGQEPPDVVCLSLPIGAYANGKALYEATLALPDHQRPLFVIGGQPASQIPDILLRKAHFPEAYIIIGEGEVPLVDFLEYVQGKRQLNEVRNLMFAERGAPDGEPRVHLGQPILPEGSQGAPFILGDPESNGEPDLEQIVRLAKGGAMVYLEASRGCSRGCEFCGGKTIYGFPARHRYGVWRPRAVGAVLSDIEYLVRNDILSFNFADEEFFGPHDEMIHRAYAIAEGITSIRNATGKTLRFSLDCRADSIWSASGERRSSATGKTVNQLREAALDRLVDAGLDDIALGIESGCQSQLDYFAKKCAISEITRAIDILRTKKVRITVGLIPFSVNTTIGELRETGAFLEENGLHDVVTNYANTQKLYPGTPAAARLGLDNLPTRISAADIGRNCDEYIKIERMGTEEPDFNTLTYPYRFLHPEIDRICAYSAKDLASNNHLFYSLKALRWDRPRGLSEDAYVVCMKALKQIRERKFKFTFKDLLDIAEDHNRRDKASAYDDALKISVADQADIAQQMMADLADLVIDWDAIPLLEDIRQAASEILGSGRRV